MLLGGPRIDHKLALELGFDAGFGPGTKPSDVANYLVARLCADDPATVLCSRSSPGGVLADDRAKGYSKAWRALCHSPPLRRSGGWGELPCQSRKALVTSLRVASSSRPNTESAAARNSRTGRRRGVIYPAPDAVARGHVLGADLANSRERQELHGVRGQVHAT